MRYGQEGEERLLTAVGMWLRRQIELRLPEDRRGIHAPRLDSVRLTEEVVRALRRLADELAVEVKSLVPEPARAHVPRGLTKRLSVMDNDAPCVVCKKVRRVAILDYRDGECVAVECETCATEFTSDRRD